MKPYRVTRSACQLTWSARLERGQTGTKGVERALKSCPIVPIRHPTVV